jgi:serine/threonine protein kinase
VEVSAAVGQEILHGEVVARALCNWGERLWNSILASTDELNLASVRLDVPDPHEGYHGRWDRGRATDDLADLWRAEIPLRLLGRDVGRLEVSGYRDEEPVAMKIAALARMADIAGADLESAEPQAAGPVPKEAGGDEPAPEEGTTQDQSWPTIPPYEILEELAPGRWGIVYLARHTLLGRLVALKVTHSIMRLRPDDSDRFLMESQHLIRLHHPNIAVVYDAGRVEGRHFLAMEYVEGANLADLVRERGALPITEACEYIRQTALALEFAFEQGMVHRDIKPHNLIRTNRGEIKILDFGLARFAQAAEGPADVDLTGESVVMGTADYMAPEQAHNAHAADIRADIYSLGCTLYFLLMAQPPFVKATDHDVRLAHVNEEPPALHLVRPDVPAELSAVVAKMLAKAQSDRYQRPVEVAAALARFCPEAAAALRLDDEPEIGLGGGVPSPAEQLQAELVSRLKGLIPTLSPDPEGKAREVLDLTHTFNQAIRGALRDEMRPVVEQLLQAIPEDYEGKRARAKLVNGLLTALELGIQIPDAQGRPHVCSAFAVRARETDYKGNFRLVERIRTGTSQKSFPIPSPDQIQIIDTPHQEPAAHPQPARAGRGG